MIKAAQFVAEQKTELSPLQHVEAMAAALGLKFENGTYVKAPVVKRSYTKKAAKIAKVAKANTSKRRRNATPGGLLMKLQNLAVGDRSDISEETRELGGLLDAQKRVSSISNYWRTQGTLNAHFRVYRRGVAEVILERID